jgi:hypothetical protein
MEWISHLQNLSAKGGPNAKPQPLWPVFGLGAWEVDSTFGLNQYGMPLYALIVVSGDYKPFAAPGLLMFCSSDVGTDQEQHAIETLLRIALKLVRQPPIITPSFRSVRIISDKMFQGFACLPRAPLRLNDFEDVAGSGSAAYPSSVHIDKCERERRAIVLRSSPLNVLWLPYWLY